MAQLARFPFARKELLRLAESLEISSPAPRPIQGLAAAYRGPMMDPTLDPKVRAEPVAALYQQGRVHHIGTFPQLEDQMTNFTSDIDRAAAGYRTALMPWSGRSANCWSSRWRAQVYLSCTAGRQKPPSSATNRNPTQPYTPPARWSGSRHRRRRADPSGGIVLRAPPIPPQCPECCGNPRLLRRGTGSSNPSPSSAESGTNRTGVGHQPTDRDDCRVA